MSAPVIRGSLLGGAIGDALGAPVEFMSWREIRDRFGDDGIMDYAPAYGRVGAITDDTQMTLWTAEGILRGISRGMERGIGGPMSCIPHAYLRWLYTQDGRLPRHLDEFTPRLVLGGDDTAPGWMLGIRDLHARRAPGNTCLSALRASALGSRGRPLNDSKGCGGVMRVAPAALVPGVGDVEAYELACDAAALTHGHPTGWIAAGALAWLLVRVRDGQRLEPAVRELLVLLRTTDAHEETSRALERALALVVRGVRPTPDAIESLGGGWVAEEALAIGVCAALVAEDDFACGVRIAVNHSGDSDSTGSIAGQLLGMQLGDGALPGEWLSQLELRREIEAVADDLATGYEEGDEWWARYPGY